MLFRFGAIRRPLLSPHPGRSCEQGGDAVGIMSSTLQVPWLSMTTVLVSPGRGSDRGVVATRTLAHRLLNLLNTLPLPLSCSVLRRCAGSG